MEPKLRFPGFSGKFNKIKIKDIGSVVSGGTPDTTDPMSWSNDVLWVTPTDITALSGRYISKTKRSISKKGLKESSAKLVPEGSLLVCTRATLGEVAISKKEMTTNQGFKTIVPNHKHEVEFLYYWFSHNKNVLYRLGSGSTFLEVSKKDFDQLEVITTSKEEQQKIAACLSTWDAAIEAVEEQIELATKKKKALMQKLLTGKERLPGFEGEWISLQIGDIVEMSTGTSKAKFIDSSGDKYIIDMGSVNREGKLIPTKRTSLCGPYLTKGQLVMPKDDIGGGNIIGRAGIIEEDNKYVLSDHVYLMTPRGIDGRLLGFLINSFEVNKSLRRKANGTAQLGLGKKDVLKQIIRFPADPLEQKEIGDTLSLMDQLIDLLSERLVKLKKEKESLMQQLLG